MAQQSGHSEMSIQGGHAAVDKSGILFGGVGMPQSMEGNAPVWCGRVTYRVTMADTMPLNSAAEGSAGVL